MNPELDKFWIIDYRIYDPEGDERTKIEHMIEMLNNAITSKQVPFKIVLMDSWYASMKVIKYIESLNKIYYCPIKSNRHVDDSEGKDKHRRVDQLDWTEQEKQTGKEIHLKDMAKGHRVKLFRLVSSTRGRDYVITNDMTQVDVNVVKEKCGIRWKIEQFHRESKQVTGLEGCQCRIARALRNHIACSFLVWAHLKRLAKERHTNVYRLKFGLLDDYMRQQLKQPSYPMKLV